MKQKTLKLMEDAISSSARWTWIEMSDDSIQLEFEDVQIYKPSLEKYSKHSSEIAIRLADNVFFTLFYNNIDDIDFLKSNNDFEFSFKVLNDGLKFQDFDFFKKINDSYNYKRTLIGTDISSNNNINNNNNIKNNNDYNNYNDYGVDFLLTIAFKDMAIVCGANQLHFFNDFESLNDEDIKRLSNQWWIYYLEYWKNKGTENEYEYDSACEVFPFSNIS